MNEKLFSKSKKNKIIFIKEKRDLYHIIILIILTIIISSNSTIDENDLDESKYSYITLKIGKGTNYVYSNSYYKTAKIIYINEEKQEKIQTIYNFQKSENFVILIWEKPIENCNNMFKSCNKIF